MSAGEGAAGRLRWLLLGRSVSSLADQLLLFAVPLVVYRSTASVAWAGLAFTAEWLPRIAGMLFASSAVGRRGATRVCVRAELGRSAAALCAALVAAAHPERPALALVPLASVSGLLFEQSYIATEIIVTRAAAGRELPRAQSRLQAIEQASQVLGPVLAALLYAGVGFLGILGVVSALFGLAGALALRVGEVRPPDGATPSPASTLAAGCRVVLGRPALLRLVGISMLGNLLFALLIASAAAITTGTFAKSSGHFGLLASAGAVSSLVACALLHRGAERARLTRLGRLAFAGIVLGSLVAFAAPSYGAYLAGYALVTGADSIFNIYVRTERVHLLSKEEFERAVGFIVLGNCLPLPVAGLVLAHVGQAWGPRAPLLAGALFAVAAASLLHASAARARRPLAPAPVPCTHSRRNEP
ncbi:MFS transporter [Sorangium sp. So ce1097]|uniref:MFS transporter n=1 Tax=Sorangium sp. So ce1097 TaxID=3133330 RepID=UPI003F642E43